MAAPSRLARPPIQEALVDVRIASGATVTEKLLEPLKAELRDRFPVVDPRRKMEAQFQAHPGQPPNVKMLDSGFHGIFFGTTDKSRIVQFRVDGFTFSQLSGYTSADDLIQESMELWETYARVVKPAAAVRLALRYVNRLLLPLRAADDFERFLRAAPNLPPDAPQGISAFLTRFIMPVTERSAFAICTQQLEFATVEGSPFTLDLDVFQEGEFATEGAGLRAKLLELRPLTDQLFFSFLTDEALEPYR